jgi:hypothetical protein
MSRDLSKSLLAQKNTEVKSKSRFGEIKNNRDFKEEKSSSQAMIKLTATITQKEWDYLQKQVLEHSIKKGRIQNASKTLREILSEHKESCE